LHLRRNGDVGYQEVLHPTTGGEKESLQRLKLSTVVRIHPWALGVNMKVNKKLDRILASTKWLKMVERYFINTKGDINSWTFVERNNSRGAAIAVAKTPSGSYIIIKEFRVPFGDYVYSFPAGMIDNNETPAEAGLRELEEETGYRGKVRSTSRALSSSAGLTNEIIYMVYIECDEEPKSHVRLEMSEDIEVFKLPLYRVSSWLTMNSDKILDAKLYNVLKENI